MAECPCVCGHVEDEHEATFLAPCAIEDCDCECFDEDDCEEGRDG